MLVDSVFGADVPPAERNSLQSHVSRLRARLRPLGVAIETRRDAYRLVLGEALLDLRRFREDAGEGARALASGDPARARHHLLSALAW